jgi:hypothetical protein
MRTFLIGVLISGIAVAAETDNPIAFGPYIQNVSTSGAVICWSTYTDNKVSLKGDGGNKTNREYEHHEMPFTRLKANTEYQFDVLGDGSDFGKGSFKTYSKEIEPYSFVLYGDTRSNHDIHRRIVELASKEDPKFVINSGDLVSNGLAIADWEIFFDVNREMMKTVPYYPVLGNHEKDTDYYFEFFNLPGNERYYEFSVGDVLFLVLDSEGSEFSKPKYVKDSDFFWSQYQRDYFVKQKAWVENMLNVHKDAGFVFAFFHQPLISVKGSRVEGAKQRRAFWGDIFERHGVQAVVSGHDHHYHRAEINGVQHITSGGGGAGLYDGDKLAPETKKFKKVNHFIRVDIDEDTATFTSKDLDGNLIETVSVGRRTSDGPVGNSARVNR